MFGKCKLGVTFFDKLLSTYQWSFRKGFSTQNCHLTMLENGEYLSIMVKLSAHYRHLSKAFDYLDYQLLTAKQKAHGFILTALKLILDYSLNRKQQTQKHSSYSIWYEIILVLLQGSKFLIHYYLISFLFDRFL